MNKKIYILIFIGIACNNLFAQKKQLSIEDAVLKKNTTLAPDRLQQLQWIPGTNNYSYIGKTDGKEFIMIVHTDNKPADSTEATDKFLSIMRRYDDKFTGFPKFPAITWLSKDRFRFIYKNKVLIYNIILDNIINPFFTDFNGFENFDFANQTNNLAITRNDSMFVTVYNETTLHGNPNNAHIIFAPTKDGNVLGHAVHRNEFGINKGTFWSHKGMHLAYYDMDESMVTTYPIISLDEQPSKAKLIRYPMAGDKSHEVKLKIYNMLTKAAPIEVNTTGPAEQYLTNISWSTDETQVYIAIVNREQNHMWLNSYNSETGDFQKTLFEEKHDKYVEPLHPMIFPKNMPGKFIWQSNRDGYNHLYLYGADGMLEKQLTTGNYEVTDYYGDDIKGNIYFQATKESPTEKHIYKLNIKGELLRLDTGEGTHSSIFSEDFSFFIDIYSNIKTPRVVNLHNNTKNKIVKNLLNAANPMKDYRMPNIKFFTIKAADNETDLYCRLLTPSNMIADKKYPVLVYLYGGPHAQMVVNQWMGGADYWMHAMAEQGYIVFTVDNRGSMNRGRDFENVTHRQLGTIEMADQLAGVEWLKKQEFVDSTRMAVHGWSFGGFMTTTIMTKSPNTFKVGVCGGPVIDWSMYEIMYTERYMDMPSENPEGYKNANLLNYADKLQGKLLMIHGTSDDIVLWEHSLKYIKASVEKGKQLDYFVYPEHLHNVTGKDRAHLIVKITNYIKDNLK